MNNFRYQLDKSSKQHLCPSCGKRRFVRYVDFETKQYLQEKYGKCNRLDNCGYHLNPYKDGFSNNEPKQIEYKPFSKEKPQPIYFIPETILNATLKDYDKNTFVQNLLKLAPAQDIEKVISLYRIGTIPEGTRLGACCFPFIDKAGNIRTIQAKEFDETNHTKSTNFLHSMLSYNYPKQGKALPGWLIDYEKNEGSPRFVSCLFGEHLLNKFPLNPIALVEAPKTAIIATLHYGLPDNPAALLWLAVYNKSSLTIDKCKALQGRKVVLFPDLNAFSEWNLKAKEMQTKIPNTQFVVSDLLEKNASESERNYGLDLADYITRFNYSAFRKQTKQSVPLLAQSRPQVSSSSNVLKIVQPIQPENTIIPANRNYFVEISTRENIRRDYIGDDGILHIHYPGIPELN